MDFFIYKGFLFFCYINTDRLGMVISMINPDGSIEGDDCWKVQGLYFEICIHKVLDFLVEKTRFIRQLTVDKKRC